MKKILVTTITSAVAACAMAETLVFDVSMKVKTTVAKTGSIRAACIVSNGTASVTYRKQGTIKVQGLIWGCSCDSLIGPLTFTSPSKDGCLFWNLTDRQPLRGAKISWPVLHRIDNKKDNAYGRISYIDEMYDREFYDEYYWKKAKHPLYDKVFGNYEKISEIVRTSESKDLIMYSVKRFTYDPGKHKTYDNIATYVEEFPIKQTVITHSYTYDLKSYNPFYGLVFAYADMKGYYLNLPVSEHVETVVAGNLSKVEDISFSYDGMHYMNDKHYPRQWVTLSSETNVPTHTYILYKK
jgi:hypothetical protein